MKGTAKDSFAGDKKHQKQDAPSARNIKVADMFVDKELRVDVTLEKFVINFLSSLSSSAL